MISRPHDEQTIIAQCTPQGTGALALLRLSGRDTFHIAAKFGYLPSKKQLDQTKTHTIEYGWIVDEQGKKIDQVLFFIMHGPNTFTGENTLEITCHNNQLIVDAIIRCALYHGARLADPGEFSKRAVLNDKLDIIQAEAINELIHANNEQALAQSLAQLQGTLSQWIQTLEQDLIKALAMTEACFEFVEEEMDFKQQIKESVVACLDKIQTLQKQFNQQKQIREGVRVVLIGSVNVGKSSLFNVLVSHERAIVSGHAGTTRDTIEAQTTLDNRCITLVDTAGLRTSNNAIEAEGIKRSNQEAHKADIILLVYDNSRALKNSEKKVYDKLLDRYAHKIIEIQNKIDLVESKGDEGLAISTKQPHTITAVHKALNQKIDRLFEKSSPFLLNQRHFNLMIRLESQLEYLIKVVDTSSEEIIAFYLKDAIAQLTGLTGKSVTEQAMNSLFKSFCIGK